MASLERRFSPAHYCRGLGPSRLIGEECKNDLCEKPLIFPPRDICPTCQKDTSEPQSTPRAVEMNKINTWGPIIIFQLRSSQEKGRGI